MQVTPRAKLTSRFVYIRCYNSLMIEDKLLDSLKKVAFRPNPFTYAWKRRSLDKLFKDLSMWNIAIFAGEVWLVEEETVHSLIPMRSGDIKVFRWSITEQSDKEEWADFVERSCKQSLDYVNSIDLEREVQINKKDKIWYHFKFGEKIARL